MVFPAPARGRVFPAPSGKVTRGFRWGGNFPVLSVIVIDLKLASIFLNVGRKFYSDFLVSLLPNTG